MIISCYLLASCGPEVNLLDRQKENIYYVPSSPNTPLSSDKNDLDFNLVHSSGSRYSGWDLHAAYLPSSRIGIIGGFSSAKNPGAPDDYMKYKRFELGAGYIIPLAKGWHFETYAGAGKSSLKNYHYYGYSKFDLTNYFLQPAFAFNNTRRTFTFGIVSRFSGVNFSVRDTLFNSYDEKFTADQMNSLYDHPFHIMWEPGIIMRWGWKHFQFQGGYSYSADLTNSSLHRSTNNVSLGISLLFNTVKGKKGN